MALINSRVPFRIALAGVVISALALSACGRKGPLEPPPRAAIVEEEVVVDDGTVVESEIVEEKARTKPNRSFPLDFLI